MTTSTRKTASSVSRKRANPHDPKRTSRTRSRLPSSQSWVDRAVAEAGVRRDRVEEVDKERFKHPGEDTEVVPSVEEEDDGFLHDDLEGEEPDPSSTEEEWIPDHGGPVEKTETGFRSGDAEFEGDVGT